jgi:transcription termination factor Rho
MGIEAASTLRKQDLMFSILKVRAESGAEIMGMGTIEVLNDGFGFLRRPEAHYLAGPDDIYVVPQLVRRCGLRTGRSGETGRRGRLATGVRSRTCSSQYGERGAT